MDGTITFTSLSDLAEFLREFAGSTAKFTVKQTNMGIWELTFTGGF